MSEKDIQKTKTVMVSFVSIHDYLAEKKAEGIPLSDLEEDMLGAVNKFFDLCEEQSQPLSEDIINLLKELVKDIEVDLEKPLSKEDE